MRSAVLAMVLGVVAAGCGRIRFAAQTADGAVRDVGSETEDARSGELVDVQELERQPPPFDAPTDAPEGSADAAVDAHDSAPDASPDAVEEPSLDSPADAGVDAERPAFGAGVLVPELRSATLRTSNPTLTQDEREIYFIRRANSATQGDIYVATRPSSADAWGPITYVTELNSAADEAGLHLSYDERTMYFASLRGGVGGHDIFSATRAGVGTPFGVPSLSRELSSAASESSPSADAAETCLALWVGSTPRDLFESRRRDVMAPWSTPVAIGELATSWDDHTPTLSSDALAVYFVSDRPGVGGTDIWVARRATTSSAFGAAEAVPNINTPMNESTPWLSADERVLYYASDIDGQLAIYRSSR